MPAAVHVRAGRCRVTAYQFSTTTTIASWAARRRSRTPSRPMWSGDWSAEEPHSYTVFMIEYSQHTQRRGLVLVTPEPRLTDTLVQVRRPLMAKYSTSIPQIFPLDGPSVQFPSEPNRSFPVIVCPQCGSPHSRIIASEISDEFETHRLGEIGLIQGYSDPFYDQAVTIWLECDQGHIFVFDLLSRTKYLDEIACGITYDSTTLRAEDSDKWLSKMPYAEYLKTEHWKQVRREALERADGRCQVCNSDAPPLDTHHRTYERRGHERPNDVIVLCRDCHGRFHDKLPYSDNRHRLKFREVPR